MSIYVFVVYMLEVLCTALKLHLASVVVWNCPGCPRVKDGGGLKSMRPCVCVKFAKVRQADEHEGGKPIPTPQPPN